MVDFSARATAPISILSIFVITLSLPPAEAYSQPQVLAELAVHPGTYERVDVPITADLRGVALPLQSASVQLYEVTGGRERPVASQLEPGSPPRLTWILHGRTAPGKDRTYELRSVDDDATRRGSTVEVDDDGRSLRVHIGDRPVLEYRYARQPAPAGVDSLYGRSGFIHPLWSPDGEVLTRIQPPDHYHHYGIWNPWTRAEFEGRTIDFWNLGEGQGTVRSEHVLSRTSGDVFGGFAALHSHVDFTGTRNETVALRETWDVKVWNADPERNTWIIDFVSILNPATDEPFTIKAYRYQGFSIRATEKWNDETATLLTSEGYDKSNANATRARWIDVGGVSDAAEGTSGILFLTHPTNYNFPEQLRIWPVGMNAGKENVYVNFNPAQESDWEMRPGQSHTLQYRMVVYDGKIDSVRAERYWQNFAYPPVVEVHPTSPLRGARVLVYTRNGEGYVHENIPFSVDAIEELGAEHGFVVDTSDDPSGFTEENLARYDALIFSNTNNEAFTDERQRAALQAYVQSGGGFVGIHSASGSERDWPWFSQLVGGNFVRHAPRQDFTVEILDRTHPSTAFLPDRWEVEDDESYYLKELNPRIRVLATADLNTVTDRGREPFPGDLFGDSFPVSWYQEFDGGRQWYTSLGHRPEQYDDPTFLRHILGGIRWVVDGVTP